MIRSILDKCTKSSCWIYHTNAGSCNGCDIEILDVLTPYYDAERFGIKLVGTPRHADALVVAGPVTRQVRPRLERLYEATPDPKLVVAVGACAVSGGIWHDSYSIVGGVDKVLPVDIHIPGCPPRPEAIVHGIAAALGKLETKVKSEEYTEQE